MTNTLPPEEYRYRTTSDNEAVSSDDFAASVDSDEARIALEQALQQAEHMHPVSPDDIDESRNERRQDETGRQLGHGVVESIAYQHEVATSHSEAVAYQDTTIEPTHVEIDTRSTILAQVGKMLVMARQWEVQNSKASSRND